MKLFPKFITLFVITGLLLAGCGQSANAAFDRTAMLNQYYDLGLEYAPYSTLIKKQTIQTTLSDGNQALITFNANNQGQVTDVLSEKDASSLHPQVTTRMLYDYKNAYVEEYKDDMLIKSGHLFLDEKGNVIAVETKTPDGQLSQKNLSFNDDKIASTVTNNAETTINTQCIWENNLITKKRVTSPMVNSQIFIRETTFFYSAEGKLEKTVLDVSAGQPLYTSTTLYSKYNQFGDWTEATVSTKSDNYPLEDYRITRHIEYWN